MRHGFAPELLTEIEEKASTRSRRVATFDFDNTSILGDIGQGFSHYLTRKLLYKFEDERFWALIHEDDGRSVLRKLVKEVNGNTSHPRYRNLVAELNSIYLRKLSREGKYAAYSWAVLLHVGLSVEELERYSRDAIREELLTPRVFEEWEDLKGEIVQVERGIRPFQEILKMMMWLERQGFEIWVVSASNWWTVKIAAMALFNIPAERIIGMRNIVEENMMMDKIDPPVMYREGKREGIKKHIGVTPIVAFGDTTTDIEMLEFAEIGVGFDRGNEEFKEAALKNNWWFQPQSSLTPLTNLGPFVRAFDY